jgi:hypothetical protein
MDEATAGMIIHLRKSSNYTSTHEGKFGAHMRGK